MIYSSFNSSSVTIEAIALAAATFIGSVIPVALASSAPLKIPGNTSTLLIWLGKSERPVATILAPPALASSGMISGVGFAIAKMIGSLAIDSTISFVMIPGADTPMNTSLPLITSASVPASLFLFVTAAIACFAELSLGSPSTSAPWLSTRITSLAPNLWKSLQIEIPAEPAPLITMLISSHFFPTILSAFVRPAVQTIAVPC